MFLYPRIKYVLGIMAVVVLAQSAHAGGAGQIREYFVAAEPVEWNYAPSGENKIKPKMGLGDWGDQLVYSKLQYIEYTDDTFATKVPQEPHLGIMGPVFRGAVGDTFKIHFLNRGKKPYSIHPHGVFYDKDNEGADYAGMTGAGGAIKPGEKYTYTWDITPEAGPAKADLTSMVWLYHSHVDSVSDMYEGLLGAMIVTDRKHANDDGRPKDVDREFVNLFMVFNENGDDEDEEGHLMHAINGYIFGNQPGLEMNEKERIRWHLIGMGTEVDLHTPHWHGGTVIHDGHRKDSVDLLAGTMTSADMKALNPGTWLYHCHVTDHITAGMISLYTVNPK
jgi:FtsP/CotA-like multicopper oxidase with cupredoxin domain